MKIGPKMVGKLGNKIRSVAYGNLERTVNESKSLTFESVTL